MQQLPGLDGVAKKRLDSVNCHNTFDLTPEQTVTADLGFSYDYIQVSVRFRTRAQETPQAFMGLQFWEGTGPQTIGLLLGSVTRSTDHQPTEIDSHNTFTGVDLRMSNELGSWIVGSLHKTTVLSSGA